MNQFFLLFMLFIGGAGFAQEKVNVQGNKVTSIESAPVWPGCEAAESAETCFYGKLTEHIKASYKFPKDKNGNFIRGKSTVSFNITAEGEVEILKVEGPKNELNEEAKRIILALPEMKPGKRAGKPVKVKYTVPFTW